MPQKLSLTSAPAPAETRPAGPPPRPANDELAALAHECPARLRELVWSGDERISLAACQEVLNRGYGKPGQSSLIEGGGPALTVVVIREGRANV